MKLAFLVSFVSRGRFHLVSAFCLGGNNLRFLRVSVSLPAPFPFRIYRVETGNEPESKMELLAVRATDEHAPTD
jgi:hypothetical protein